MLVQVYQDLYNSSLFLYRTLFWEGVSHRIAFSVSFGALMIKFFFFLDKIEAGFGDQLAARSLWSRRALALAIAVQVSWYSKSSFSLLAWQFWLGTFGCTSQYTSVAPTF